MAKSLSKGGICGYNGNNKEGILGDKGRAARVAAVPGPAPIGGAHFTRGGIGH